MKPLRKVENDSYGGGANNKTIMARVSVGLCSIEEAQLPSTRLMRISRVGVGVKMTSSINDLPVWAKTILCSLGTVDGDGAQRASWAWQRLGRSTFVCLEGRAKSTKSTKDTPPSFPCQTLIRDSPAKPEQSE